MQNKRFYKVKTVNSRKNQPSFFNIANRAKRKRNLVFSVLGAYIGIGAILGGLLFSFQNENLASEVETINTAIVVESDSRKEEYNLGEEINLRLVVQNTSTRSSLNNVVFRPYSTGQSLRFNSVQKISDSGSDLVLADENSQFRIGSIGIAQRVEYTINTTLVSTNLPQVYTWAEIGYVRDEEAFLAETGEELIYDQSNTVLGDSLVRLSTDKAEYTNQEEIVLELNSTTDKAQKGRVSITNKETLEPAYSYECNIDKEQGCTESVSNLGFGNYSAIFIAENSEVQSSIANFTITNKSQTFTPFEEAGIQNPFDKSSILGTYPIVFTKVLSQNDFVDNQECELELAFAGNVYAREKVAVDNQRNCGLLLNSQQLNKGDGEYSVSLKNSEISQTFAFFNKTEPYLSAQVLNSVINLETSIEIEIKDILNEENEALDGVEAKVGVYNSNQNSYTTYTSNDSGRFEVEEGVLRIVLPPRVFTQTGLYRIHIELADGQKTDWINLDFTNSDLGSAKSGIISNQRSLVAGEAINLEISEIRDRTSNLVNSGECEISTFEADGKQSFFEGQIKAGVCEVQIPIGRITKAGPLLTTAQAKDLDSVLPISRYFEVLPAEAQDFGSINFEYSPIRYETANTLILGPVVDEYANLVNIYNLSLQATETNEDGQKEVLRKLENFDVIDGFAEVNIPKSWLNKDEVNLEILDFNGKELTSRSIQPVKYDFAIQPADFQNTSVNDSSYTVEVQNLNNYLDYLQQETLLTLEDTQDSEATEDTQTLNPDFDCKLELTYLPGLKEKFTQKVDTENSTCKFEVERKVTGSDTKALVKLQVQDFAWYKVIDIQSTTGSNLFEVVPATFLNQSGETVLQLQTTPIFDQYGNLTENGNIRWKINGKSYETNIQEGRSKIQILARDIDPASFRTLGEGNKVLNLDISATHSATSISKTNSLEIYIGDKSIANSEEVYNLLQGSSHVTVGESVILVFDTEICQAVQLNRNQRTELPAHYQAGKCYVQATPQVGLNEISIQSQGVEYTSQKIYGVSEFVKIDWCSTEQEVCELKVLDNNNIRDLKAKIYAGDNLYEFRPKDGENMVEVSQSELNPLNEYLVEIEYISSGNQLRRFSKTVSGDLIS